MQSYSEARFEAQVDRALQRVRTLLHSSRNPQYPADVFHQYDDKYLLVEFLTNSALAGQMNCLQELGVGDWDTLKKWGEKRSVTLRFRAQEHCEFVKKKKRKEESPTVVTETKFAFGTFGKGQKIVSTFTDYIWKLVIDYEIFAFQGTNTDEKIVLKSRTGSLKLVTSYESAPKPKDSDITNFDMNLTWLLQNLSDFKELSFSINRKSQECHTPRRNPDIDASLNYFANFYIWSDQVRNYFDNIFSLQENHGLDLSKMDDEGIFVPVVPLYDEAALNQISKPALLAPPPAPDKSKKKEVVPPPSPVIVLPSGNRGDKSPVLPIEDLNYFLEEQTRSFVDKKAQFEKLFPEDKKGENIITFNEANIIAALTNTMNIAQFYADGVEHVEGTMRKQLISAIGKEVTPADFANYMKYHNRKIFKESFQPRPFSYAVRQPDHYPEGTIGIDLKLDDGSIAEPIHTIVSRREASSPMKFAINASTQVPFYGERYLHAFVDQQFSGPSGSSLELVARAKQFSCYILMVGRLQAADVFDPKYAIIVSNKDEIKIPLSLETIPSPQEFKDAIESLSPEQQNFAKAIRSMQLASTLFAVCVLEIKPQAEKLLKLPKDSLIKEIELTQHLLELFIKYQFPSDMLTFDGNNALTTPAKVKTVKGYAKKINDMIEGQQRAEIEAAERKAGMEKLERERQEKKRQHDIRKQQRAQTRKRRVEEKARLELQRQKQNNVRQEMGYGMDKKEKSYPNRKKCKPAAPMKNRAMNKPSSCVSPPKLIEPPPPSPIPTTSPSPMPSTEVVAQVDATGQPAHVVPSEPTKDTLELPVSDDFEPTSDNNTDIDYTKIPEELDSKFDELDDDNCLRPTIINIDNTWSKRYQTDLMTPPVQITVDSKLQEQERIRAFDLVDILSKSGNLAFEQAQFHVVIAATHCFDKSITNTVIQDNTNPIEKLERSNLIIATTVHRKPASKLVKQEHLDVVKTFSEGVFIATS